MQPIAEQSDESETKIPSGLNKFDPNELTDGKTRGGGTGPAFIDFWCLNERMVIEEEAAEVSGKWLIPWLQAISIPPITIAPGNPERPQREAIASRIFWIRRSNQAENRRPPGNRGNTCHLTLDQPIRADV